jgi:murein DD-endopeptidase MepM/ murein hydrolase activator NlpD
MNKLCFIKLIIIFITILTLSACSNKDVEKVQKIEIDLQKEICLPTDSLAQQTDSKPLPFLLSGEIPKGGTLANVLLKNDLNGNAVYAAVNSMDSIFDLRHVQPGDKFEVMTDSSRVIYELTFYRNPIKKYVVFKDSTGKMVARINEETLTLEVDQIEGVLESSLYKTVLAAGEEAALAMLFTQIFQWDIDFFIDPRQGDSIKILFEKYTLNGEHARYGNILAASYTSKSSEAIAYRYTDSKGASKYYDEKGVCFQKAFLKSPLNFTRISSKFGRRIHPITKKTSMHNGVDYAAPYGTPIEAAADGVIKQACWNAGHTGNTVIIQHPNGYKTLYGHLSKYGKYKAGHKVKQHDVIGYVGSTGRSTGNHLHYTIYHHSKPIDPLKLKNVAGPPVVAAEMADFQPQIALLKSQLSQSSVPTEVVVAEASPDTAEAVEEIYLPVTKPRQFNQKLCIIAIIAQAILIFVLLLLLLRKRHLRTEVTE